MTRRTQELERRREKEAPRRKLQRGEGSSRHPPSSAPEGSSPSSEGSPSPASPERRVPNLHFSTEKLRKRLEKFEAKKFLDNKYIDWAVLGEFGLEEEVRRLVNVGRWRRFFEIIEPTYKEITLEFLTTFSLQRTHIHWDLQDTIQFRLCGETFKMSYNRFSTHMGLYEEDEVMNPDYHQLAVSLPLDSPETITWRRLTEEGAYKSSSSKATKLRHPAWRYIHAILARTLSGRGHSHGVVGASDVYYLHSMVFDYPIHLGHALVHYIHHQSTDPRLGCIGIGPYVTRLARALGVLPSPDDMTKVSEMAPITRDTLIAMHFEPVVRREEAAADIPQPDQPDIHQQPPQAVDALPLPVANQANLSEKVAKCLKEISEMRADMTDLKTDVDGMRQLLIGYQHESMSTLARICSQMGLKPPHGFSSHTESSSSSEQSTSRGGDGNDGDD